MPLHHLPAYAALVKGALARVLRQRHYRTLSRSVAARASALAQLVIQMTGSAEALLNAGVQAPSLAPSQAPSLSSSQIQIFKSLSFTYDFLFYHLIVRAPSQAPCQSISSPTQLLLPWGN